MGGPSDTVCSDTKRMMRMNRSGDTSYLATPLVYRNTQSAHTGRCRFMRPVCILCSRSAANGTFCVLTSIFLVFSFRGIEPRDARDAGQAPHAYFNLHFGHKKLCIIDAQKALSHITEYATANNFLCVGSPGLARSELLGRTLLIGACWGPYS